jgi:hypothetical protein
VSRAPALLLDELATEILFRGERVVSRTAQGQVRRQILSALSERFQMMQLQVARLAAARAVRVGVAAPSAVTLEDLASLGCGNVSPALALEDPRIHV